MTRWTRLLPVAALLLVVVACGRGATGGNLLAPDDPRLDSGYGMGGSATGGGTGGTSTTTSTGGTAEEIPVDSTAASGYGMGGS